MLHQETTTKNTHQGGAKLSTMCSLSIYERAHCTGPAPRPQAPSSPARWGSLCSTAEGPASGFIVESLAGPRYGNASAGNTSGASSALAPNRCAALPRLTGRPAATRSWILMMFFLIWMAFL